MTNRPGYEALTLMMSKPTASAQVIVRLGYRFDTIGIKYSLGAVWTLLFKQLP